MGMIWFTADTHYGCDKLVSNSRGQFVDVKQHDQHLLDVCNSRVGRDDTLVIVGDFCKDKPGRYRPHIRCRHIFFILGNHDQETKARAVFGGNVWKEKTVKLGNGNRVLCGHHPQCFWNKSHYGCFHAYGHLHYNLEREAMMDRGFPGRRSMDVGVDAAKHHLGEYRPFSATEFLDLMSGRPGHDIITPEQRWERRDYDSEGS